MKPTLVIGTKNAKKLAELRDLLSELPITVETIETIAPKTPAPVEDGASFRDNAAIKALEYATATGMLCLADDSGLCVDQLGGAPGVHSARYAGDQGDDEANNRLLIKELDGVAAKDRGAAYHCALAIAAPGRLLLELEETCRGSILTAPRGEGGFGYDPYFCFEGWTESFAEVSAERKAEVSHRGKALRALRKELPALLSVLENQQND